MINVKNGRNVNFSLEDEHVWSCLVGAFEGGSNYWVDSIELKLPDGFKKARFDGYVDEDGKHRNVSDWYPELDSHDSLKELREKQLYIYGHQVPFIGGSVVIKELDGYDHSPKPLNRENLEKGLNIMYEKYKRHFYDLVNEGDDAITSDVLLQCAVFGEVIYG